MQGNIFALKIQVLIEHLFFSQKICLQFRSKQNYIFPPNVHVAVTDLKQAQMELFE